jgi:hypothetical protein
VNTGLLSALRRLLSPMSQSGPAGVRRVRPWFTFGGEDLRRRDWTLLTLAAGRGAALTPVQLQKVLFVLGREVPEAVGRDYYEFRPYNYGPFSSKVYDDLDALTRLGFVAVSGPFRGQSWATYAATLEGIAASEDARAGLPEATGRYIDSLVKWARSLSFQQLVSAIYRMYPEQRANSIFKK